MRRKSVKLMIPLSIVLAFALIFGSAGYAFAEPPAGAEQVDVLVSFTEKPGSDEKALIRDKGGKVKRTYNIVPVIAAPIPRGKLDLVRINPKVASVEEDITVQIAEDALPWGSIATAETRVTVLHDCRKEADNERSG